MTDRFRSRLSRIERADGAVNRTLEVERLVKHLARSGAPVVASDGRAVFVYVGRAEEVFLFGDMTDWIDRRPLTRVADTDLFFREERYEPDARLQYRFLVAEGGMKQKRDDTTIEGLRMELDAFNPVKGGNGLGLMSEVAMPRFRRNAMFDPFLDGTPGSYSGLQEVTLPPGVLPYEHTLHIFHPRSDHGDYPVVYFQDGPDYIRFGYAPIVLQTLIDEGAIPPCLGVFITPPNLHLGKVPDRSTEYGMNTKYLAFFCDELMPFIGQLFPVRSDARSHVIVGDSYGGLASTYIAVERPDLFGGVCSQSGYYAFDADRLMHLIEEGDRSKQLRRLKIYLHVGTYERRIGTGFIPPRDQDFTAANVRMSETLQRVGVAHRFTLTREGHTWSNWREQLVEGLAYLLADR